MMYHRDMDASRRLRKIMVWGGFSLAFIVVGFLILRELTSPLPNEPQGVVSTVPPQTTPPSPEVKASYIVPPLHPKQLIVPRLGIDTTVAAVGVTQEGAIDAPHTAWEAGWYTASSTPGSGKGAVFLDGHVNDSYNTPGVFYELAILRQGDEVRLIRGDDAQFVYKVTEVSTQPVRELDMKKALRSIEPGKEGLTLITCGGQYDKKTATYNDRVIVYAVKTS